MNKVDILIFAAHPDDAELSMAGTILKHKAKGYSVGIIDLTQGELGSRGTVETRYAEAAEAAKLMHLDARVNLQMADGFFTHDEFHLRKVIEQIRKFQPKIVFCNAPSDRHPDHGKGSKLVSEACFLSGLLKIETHFEGENQLPHRPKVVYHYIQDRMITPDFVIDVSEYVDKKIEIVKAFKTQFFQADSTEPQTPISGENFFEFLRGRMSELGRNAGVRYAEGFLKERNLLVRDVFDLD